PDLWPRIVAQLPTPARPTRWRFVWAYGGATLAAAASLTLLWLSRSPMLPPEPQTPPVFPHKSDPRIPPAFVSMVSEARQIGLAESETLLQETRPPRPTERAVFEGEED